MDGWNSRVIEVGEVVSPLSYGQKKKTCLEIADNC